MAALFEGFSSYYLSNDDDEDSRKVVIMLKNLFQISMQLAMIMFQLGFPYKDLRFIGYYFYLVKKSSSKLFRLGLRLAILIMYYNAVRFAILLLFSLDDYGRVILYDVIYEMKLYYGKIPSLIGFVASVCGAYAIEFLFLNPLCLVNLNIEDILAGRLSFFIHPYYNSVRIDFRLRKLCLILMNSMQWFLIVEGL